MARHSIVDQPGTTEKSITGILINYSKMQCMQTEISIRRGFQKDLKTLQELYVNTINTICTDDYTAEQLAVWSSSVEDIGRWNRIFSAQFLIVAEVKGQIAGFASSENSYLDMLFVHKDCQRLGIAKRLYNTIEKKMKNDGHAVLTVNASKTAVPFFKAAGCCLVREQTLLLKEVMITNCVMEKNL